MFFLVLLLKVHEIRGKITKKNPYTQVYGHKNAFFLYFVTKSDILSADFVRHNVCDHVSGCHPADRKAEPVE